MWKLIDLNAKSRKEKSTGKLCISCLVQKNLLCFANYKKPNQKRRNRRESFWESFSSFLIIGNHKKICCHAKTIFGMPSLPPPLFPPFPPNPVMKGFLSNQLILSFVRILIVKEYPGSFIWHYAKTFMFVGYLCSDCDWLRFRLACKYSGKLESFPACQEILWWISHYVGVAVAVSTVATAAASVSATTPPSFPPMPPFWSPLLPFVACASGGWWQWTPW